MTLSPHQKRTIVWPLGAPTGDDAHDMGELMHVRHVAHPNFQRWALSTEIRIVSWGRKYQISLVGMHEAGAPDTHEAFRWPDVHACGAAVALIIGVERAASTNLSIGDLLDGSDLRPSIEPIHVRRFEWGEQASWAVSSIDPDCPANSGKTLHWRVFAHTGQLVPIWPQRPVSD